MNFIDAMTDLGDKILYGKINMMLLLVSDE